MFVSSKLANLPANCQNSLLTAFRIQSRYVVLQLSSGSVFCWKKKIRPRTVGSWGFEMQIRCCNDRFFWHTIDQFKVQRTRIIKVKYMTGYSSNVALGYQFKLPLVILFLLPGLLVHAQKKDLLYYQCAFYESYRSGNMEPWPKLIEEMEQVKPADRAWQTEIIKAMYGLVGYQIGLHDKGIAKTYISKADIYLEKLLKKHPDNAQLHSLSGAFYGYKIALAIYKAPFLGPKSMEHIDQSIKLDPAEPMGYIEKGNSLHYRPAIFGGDKLEALKYYRKALALFEARHNMNCNWQQMLLRAFILKNLYETNQKAEAASFFSTMQRDYGPMSWIEAFVGAEFMGKH
jgi:hypothetical protein